MAGSKEVALIGATQYPVLDKNSEAAAAMEEVLSENFGADGVGAFDLDRITIPAGGGIAWEVPSLDGPQSTQEIEGVIVAWSSPRAYWKLSMDESDGGSAPDCSSDDGAFGLGEYGMGSEGNPSGRCDQCPMNQWESDPDGRGKACKESRLLFMLLPDRVLPVTVSMAPTSIQPLRKYLLRLAGEATPYYGVTTKLRLKKVEGNGVKYSVVEPSVGGRLEPETRAMAKEYGEQIKKAFSVHRDTGADVAASRAHGTPGAPVDPQPGSAPNADL